MHYVLMMSFDTKYNYYKRILGVIMSKRYKTLYDLLGMNNTSLKVNSNTIQDLNNQLQGSLKVEPKDNFLTLKAQLISFLREYYPEELIVAINIVELWPPNISATFKQSILLNTFLSIPEKKFKCNKTIKTYEEFERFTEYLITIFPDFPMMEDYVPEIDWGEVKFELDNQLYNIFYGGVIERVPDFIHAFLIVHGDKPDVLEAISCVLQVQDYVINQLKHIIELPKSIDSGYLEVPSIQFWTECRKVLANLDEHIKDVPNILSISLGKESTYSNLNEFSSAFMQSQVNQNIFVQISGKYYPFSIRNCASVVIDKFSKKSTDVKNVSFRLLEFINRRVKTSSEQPLLLFDSNQLYSTVVTAVLHAHNQFYFIIILDDDEDTVEVFESNLQKALKSDYWGFKRINSPYAFNIKNEDEELVSREKIEILYVTGGVTTVMGMHKIPKYGKVFPFSEFISIFDSIETMDEFVDFLSFVEKHKKSMFSPLSSLADKFGSFKDSNGILEKGAITYDVIALDPHTGSNWRYKYLTSYWKDLSVSFPDKKTKWIPKKSYDNIQFLGALDGTKYSWSTKIERTNIHFVVQVEEFIYLPQVNGRMLDFFAESATDALSQRREILSQLDAIQQYHTVIFECELNKEYLINDKGEVAPIDVNFFDSLVWEVHQNDNRSKGRLTVSLSINIIAMKNELDKSINSEFQGRLTKKVLEIIHINNNAYISESISELLEKSYENNIRVSLGSRSREFDSLESFHNLPKPEHYITARKELAKIIRDAGYEKKRYELNSAKQVINDIASKYLAKLQEVIATYDKYQLIIAVLSNYDAYIYYKYNNSYRAMQSLEHEVAFDREESVYELQSSFAKNSNDLRYLLERLIANNFSGVKKPLQDDMLLIVAYVDWLMTLYSASEVIHHGIDVGGIEIDSEYIPQVFFSDNFEDFDHEFGLEQARNNLGIDINENDSVKGLITEDLLDKLNLAFKDDLGFTFMTLVIVLDVLQSWADITKIKLANHYCASLEEVINVCFKTIYELEDSSNVSKLEISKATKFLILDPKRVLKKLDSEIEEFDVPVLEYNKRDQRLNIKPLISLDNRVIWSAGCAYRTRGIWLDRIIEGRLPANFSWGSVNTVVDNLKVDIEKELEKTTFKVFNRHYCSSFCHHGIDFKRRFKKEGFDDVGDYDVLAYIPKSNTWIMVECKYNQTPYCLQDMKRLREKVFGSGKKTHIPKIMKRYEFLEKNHSKICKLLGYLDHLNSSPNIVMLYVTREIYWIHRRPPYPTDIQFIQIDKLDSWLTKNKDEWENKSSL